MEIRKIDNNQITFQKIWLVKAEREKAMKLLMDLSVNKTPKSIENLKLKIFDIFDSHLQKEALIQNKLYIHREDFLQTLYLKFFEFLDMIHEKIILPKNFIETLNKIKPSKNDYIEQNIRLNRNISKNATYEDFLTEENLPVYVSQKNKKEREVFERKIMQTLQDVDLTEKEKKVLDLKKQGKSFVEISNEIKISETTVGLAFLSAIAKIQKQNNILPKSFEEIAYSIKKQYELEIQEEKIVDLLIKNPDLLRFFKNDWVNNIKNYAFIINVSEKDFILSVLKQPTLVHLKPETIKQNLVNAANLMHLPRENYINIALKEPHLFIQKPETIMQNISVIAEGFGISQKDMIKVALKQPNLFIRRPDTIFINVKNSANIFNVSIQDFVKAALRKPALFYLSSNNLKEHVAKTSSIFNITEQNFIKLALNQPNLFILKPETFEQNIFEAMVNLNLEKKDFIKIAVKRPELFYLKSETIKKNISNSAEIFGISEEEFLKAAIKKPQLFYQKPETLKQNIIKASEIFGITEQELVIIALKQPALFYQKPETLKKNILGIAFVLGLNEKEMFSFAQEQPILFQLKPENIEKKVKINNFYHKIYDKYGKRNIHFVKESYEKLYLKPLVYYVRKSLNGTIPVNLKNLIKIIQDNKNKIFTFDLPKDECTEEFIQYVKEFFAKNIGTENYKFLIEGKEIN